MGRAAGWCRHASGRHAAACCHAGKRRPNSWMHGAASRHAARPALHPPCPPQRPPELQQQQGAERLCGQHCALLHHGALPRLAHLPPHPPRQREGGRGAAAGQQRLVTGDATVQGQQARSVAVVQRARPRRAFIHSPTSAPHATAAAQHGNVETDESWYPTTKSNYEKMDK